MKNSAKLFGIIVFVAVIGFSMIACSDPDVGTPPPPRVSYVSSDAANGNMYELVITEAANNPKYIAKEGDTYVLTITGPNGNLVAKSTGTVEKIETNTTYKLKHSGGNVITVTVSNNGDNIITKIDTNTPDSTIPVDGGFQPVRKPEPTGLTGLEFEPRWGDTEYTVSKGRVTGGEVIIPAYYKGLPVTAIKENAFNSTRITSVTMPPSIDYIGYMAFGWCYGLTSIIIPENVNYIGPYAFAWANITSVNIPAKVDLINPSTFSGCRNLTSITVAASNPNYISEGGILYNKGGVGDKMILYSWPSASGTVTIPASVTSISGEAFRYCTLTSVTIPTSVTFIGEWAFMDCENLTGITVAAGNTSFSSEGGILYNNGKTELIVVPGGISGAVTIPSGVTFIHNEAFVNCTKITSVTIPTSVTSLGRDVFEDWTSSQTINVPFASRQAADNAWGASWRNGCNATIKYWNGSSYQ